MSKEEIKQRYSMMDVVVRYGFRPNRSGFINCPFHKGDHTASLKIYPKDFYCHACGKNGDIFTFVELMEGVSFKEAFQILGGTYEKPTYASRLAVYHAKKLRQTQQRLAGRLETKKTLNRMLLDIYRAEWEKSEPLSDYWCDMYNKLQYQLYLHSMLNGLETRW